MDLVTDESDNRMPEETQGAFGIRMFWPRIYGVGFSLGFRVEGFRVLFRGSGYMGWGFRVQWFSIHCGDCFPHARAAELLARRKTILE